MLFKNLKTLIQENKAFFIPFLLWVIVGGILLTTPGNLRIFWAVNQTRAAWLDYAMTFFTALGQAEFISIVILSLFILPAYRTRRYLILAVMAGLSVTLVSQGLKFLFDAPRPLTVFPNHGIGTVPWLSNNFYHSFPSGHTLGAFAFFAFYSFFLSPKYKKFSYLFFVLALLCGISRMYLGQHFFIDVYWGSIFGVVFISFLYTLMETYFFKKVHPLI